MNSRWARALLEGGHTNSQEGRKVTVTFDDPDVIAVLDKHKRERSYKETVGLLIRFADEQLEQEEITQ